MANLTRLTDGQRRGLQVGGLIAAVAGFGGERAGSGLGRGLTQSGMTMGGASRDVIKIKCRSCGYLESEDAKFCSGCGQAV